jgi:hypothetical protein
MSNSNSIESFREPLLKKGYIKIFTTGTILIIAGFIATSVFSIIPRPSYSDPGYDAYINLMRAFMSISRLFLQIGMVLFILSFFIGALTDRTLSDNVKKGMILASGVAIFGLVILIMYSTVMIY